MRRTLLTAALLLVVASPVFAQSSQTNGVPARLGATFAPAAPQGSAAHRSFTVFVNLGPGIQHDSDYQQTEVGLSGLNFGAGWFVTDRLAVLVRFSGTTVTYFSSVSQASGVWGGTIQYWMNDWASVEAGAGFGRWWDEFSDSETGVGLIIGFQASAFHKGNHHFRVGFEYAPVFTDIMVQNVGFTVGYQYAKTK
jgi:hypothetical protein